MQIFPRNLSFSLVIAFINFLRVIYLFHFILFFVLYPNAWQPLKQSLQHNFCLGWPFHLFVTCLFTKSPSFYPTSCNFFSPPQTLNTKAYYIYTKLQYYIWYVIWLFLYFVACTFTKLIIFISSPFIYIFFLFLKHSVAILC